MKWLDIMRYVPPGISLKWHGQYYTAAFLLAPICSSLVYFSNLDSCLSDLRYWFSADPTMTFHIPVFSEILRGSLNFFPLYASGSLFFILYHYIYHFRETKSIYLMRRLPDRWELHRRCLALPLFLSALLLLFGLVMLLIFFAAYHTNVTAQYIPPEQWAEFWR